MAHDIAVVLASIADVAVLDVRLHSRVHHVHGLECLGRFLDDRCPSLFCLLKQTIRWTVRYFKSSFYGETVSRIRSRL
jgi:hypothetical protein